MAWEALAVSADQAKAAAGAVPAVLAGLRVLEDQEDLVTSSGPPAEVPGGEASAK